MQAAIKPRVVLAPRQSAALSNLIISPKEVVVSEATFEDLVKARAYKYSVKALREEHEEVTNEDVAASQVTRHARLGFSPSSCDSTSKCFVACNICLMLTARFQAYEIGRAASCSGIAAATSDHDAIASIVEEKLQPIQEQLSALVAMKEQLSALMAMNQNQKREAQNIRAFADDGLLLLLSKTKPGHPQREPNDPKLQELQRPVPVGNSPPSLSFFPKKGLATPKVNKLTGAQIDDLEWYYNEEFSGELL
jgi:hypothetical protein